MKTKEELNALKKEVETLNEKLAELTEEELAEVSGGLVPDLTFKHGLVRPVYETPVLESSDLEPGVISTVGFKTKRSSFSDLSAPLK